MALGVVRKHRAALQPDIVIVLQRVSTQPLVLRIGITELLLPSA